MIAPTPAYTIDRPLPWIHYRLTVAPTGDAGTMEFEGERSAPAGRIQEWVNGSLRLSYDSKAKDVSFSAGKVFAQLDNGSTAEYENGSLKRTF